MRKHFRRFGLQQDGWDEELTESFGRAVKGNSGSQLLVSSGIAAIDQGLLSLLSFGISILLIKNVPKTEYGYYAIAVAINLLLISIQNAIVNTPLTLLISSKKGPKKENYVSSLCYGQLIGIVPAVCAGLAFVALSPGWVFDSTQASVAAGVCVGSVGLLLREFSRTYFFAGEAPLVVLKMDALYSGLVMALIGLTYLFLNVSVASVLVLMGVGALAVFLIEMPRPGWRYDRTWINKSYRENWELGKWALLGVVVTHVQNHSYLYLLGLLLSSSEVAEVSAARLLLMPVFLMQAGWGKVAVPHGAKLREGGLLRAFFKDQVLASLIVGVGIAVYVGFLVFYSDLITDIILTPKYKNSKEFVILWAVIFGLNFMAMNASLGLQVAREFQIITKINAITMVLSVGMTYYLIKNHGADGAFLSLIIGYLLLGVGLWAYFGKKALGTSGR